MIPFAADSWFWQCVGLFLLTFVHEDVAVVAAAYVHVQYRMPFEFALASLFAGVVVSDLAIYALGRAARLVPWLRSKLIGKRVHAAGAWLNAHTFSTVALCRMTPGILFPTFLACGWFRVPAQKFLLASMASSAVYTPVALFLVNSIGKTVLTWLGHWGWLGTLAVILVLTIRGARNPPWRPKGEISASSALTWARRAEATERKGDLRSLARAAHRHEGMPLIGRLSRFVSPAERTPCGIFYLPVMLQWLWLSLRYRSFTLPSVANPHILTGGFWGESKSACMNQVGAEQQQWVARFIIMDRRPGIAALEDLRLAEEALGRAGIPFPLVVKPDIGWQGYGVRLVPGRDHLLSYLAAYPPGERLLLQELIPHDGEAGVFYARRPDEPKGRLLGLALRYFPHVKGDGTSTVRELISASPRTRWWFRHYLGFKSEHLGLDHDLLDSVPATGEMVRLSFIGSIRVGGLYRDASDLISPALSERFNLIARSMPDFYFGRFDLRFESTGSLQRGEGFRIFEINGAGSEAIHAWDPERPVSGLYRELLGMQRLLFEIGATNRDRGFRPLTFREFLCAYFKQRRLLRRYPPSE